MPKQSKPKRQKSKQKKVRCITLRKGEKVLVVLRVLPTVGVVVEVDENCTDANNGVIVTGPILDGIPALNSCAQLFTVRGIRRVRKERAKPEVKPLKVGDFITKYSRQSTKLPTRQ